MNLAELLEGLVKTEALYDLSILGISLNSQEVQQGFAFLAITGTAQHGLQYAQQAIDNGAAAILYDPKNSTLFSLTALNIPCIAINQLSEHLGDIADRFYQSPSKQLNTIGITATNGKTTCSQFLAQILPYCGVIGTLGWGEYHALHTTINTTPDALTIQKILSTFVYSDIKNVAMEVSSHGLQQGRVNQIDFNGALFINLSHDHLDYHGSMARYLQAKLRLFQKSSLQFIVVNLDDKHCQSFLNAAPDSAKKWGFSVTGHHHHNAENITASDVKSNLNGIQFFAHWQGKKVAVHTKIVGRYNVENLLAVLTVLLTQNISLEDAANKINLLEPVKGRMENFGGKSQPFVCVDYAHTPDALEKLLKGLKESCQGSLNLVVGCGGNRDMSKRIEMGKIASSLADGTIITNDNPRFEAPEQIIEDIVKGFNSKQGEAQHYRVIQDREKAIQSMIKNAQKNDCIVIAGKGHESYQDIEGVQHPFSDQDIVKKALQAWTLAQ